MPSYSEMGAPDKKHSRLSCIDDTEQRGHLLSEAYDQESASCDSENQRRDENGISDGEADILGFMNRIEFMKKESSVLWLREFSDWLDQSSEDTLESSKLMDSVLSKGKYTKSRSRKQLGESSRYVSSSVQDSGGESSINILESFTDTFTGSHDHAYFVSSDKAALNPPTGDGNQEAIPISAMGGMGSEIGNLEASSHEKQKLLPLALRDSSLPDTLSAIDELIGSRSSSAHPGLPAHYQEDTLHRCQNLEEELLLLSAESYSVASSDSDTSRNSDSCKFGTSIPEADRTSIPGADQILNEESLNHSMDEDHDLHFFDEDYYKERHEKPCKNENGISLDSYAEPVSNIIKVPKPDHAKPSCTDDILADPSGGNSIKIISQDAGFMEKRKGKRMPKRRIVSLQEENFLADGIKVLSQKLNGVLEIARADMEYGVGKHISNGNDLCKSHENIDKIPALINERNTSILGIDSSLAEINSNWSPDPETDDSVRKYFHDPQVSESCLQYVRCNCLLQQGGFGEK